MVVEPVRFGQDQIGVASCTLSTHFPAVAVQTPSFLRLPNACVPSLSWQMIVSHDLKRFQKGRAF